MLKPSILSQGLRFGGRAIASRFKKPKTYIGDATQICKQIVEECWNGTFYQVSTGNFNQFWIRDFGICVDALLAMGNKDKVLSTLSFALENYNRAGKVTTYITQKGKCVDFPVMAIDSLPFLVYCLSKAQAVELVEKYKIFLEIQIKEYYNTVLNTKTGLVKKDLQLSSIKDHYVRQSSCYDNCMLAMLTSDLQQLSLINPFAGYDFKQIIKDAFWTGTYFLDDLSGKFHVAGDANVFPFWCRIFDSKEMALSVINEIKSKKLDDPFPMKYTDKRIKDQELFLPSFFASNYEGNTIWAHLGFCYIDVVSKYDQKLAKVYINKYAEVIEKYSNVLEVFNPDGTPYKRLFYVRDDGMLWASKFLSWKSL